jgi:purine-binding chemotaxis protein CheW
MPDSIEILKARARMLAQKSEPAATSGVSLTLFTRAKQTYGVRPEEVESAGRLRHLSAIPASPSWMVGAVQHQGAVLTLIDLPAFWGQDMEGIADLPTYVVLTDGERRIGLLVEELQGVLDVESAPVMYRGPERSGLQAVAKRVPRGLEVAPMVLVVSASALLQDSRLRP